MDASFRTNTLPIIILPKTRLPQISKTRKSSDLRCGVITSVPTEWSVGGAEGPILGVADPGKFTQLVVCCCRKFSRSAGPKVSNIRSLRAKGQRLSAFSINPALKNITFCFKIDFKNAIEVCATSDNQLAQQKLSNLLSGTCMLNILLLPFSAIGPALTRKMTTTKGSPRK